MKRARSRIHGCGPLSPIRTRCAEVRGTIRQKWCVVRRGFPPMFRGSRKTRNCPRASGITPMPSGWASGWCGRPSFPLRKRCTAIGIAVWSMTISSSVIVCGLLACGCGAAAELQRFEAVEPHMGTLVRIQLYADSEQRAADAFRAAFARIAQLDEALSDYKPDSELNRLSRAAAGVPVKVSADLFQVLAASQKLAEETGGAFDVTLGPVIRLWRQARKEHRSEE